MLKSSDEDFKAVIIKMLQWAIYKHACNKFKKEKHSLSKNRKKYQMKILELIVTISKIESSNVDSTVGWGGQREALVNLKIKQ